MPSKTEKDGRNSTRRLVGFGRAAALVVLAAVTAAPAAAQLGGLKKKLKAATATQETPAAAGGGTIVLDDGVIEQFITGLRAGKAHRDAAAKADTPYGRYLRAAAAYAEAKSKCDAASRTWAQRMTANQALMDKNNALLEKMMAAMEKQDTAAQRETGDSMLALQDPSCVVKEPVKPSDHFDELRKIESGAEQAELKASGLGPHELSVVRERVVAVLEGAPLPDTSPSEKDAVSKRSDELSHLTGSGQVPAAAAPAAEPAPAAAAPPPQPAAPAMSAEQQAMTDCMARNAKKHEPAIVRLGERAAAAAESGNTPAAMAIADSIRQLQMAGCPGR